MHMSPAVLSSSSVQLMDTVLVRYISESVYEGSVTAWLQ